MTSFIKDFESIKETHGGLTTKMQTIILYKITSSNFTTLPKRKLDHISSIEGVLDLLARTRNPELLSRLKQLLTELADALQDPVKSFTEKTSSDFQSSTVNWYLGARHLC